MLMLATTVQARPAKFIVQSLLKLSKSPKEQKMEKVSIMKANASYHQKLSKLPKEQNMEKVSSESKRFSLEQHMKSGEEGTKFWIMTACLICPVLESIYRGVKGMETWSRDNVVGYLS
ncbi:hypothetical protein I315_04387 [Cryptococcus gattii Ru294]|nr:hypothetical protein I315_04387 [Cryptococcus gattii Ru294]